MIFILDCSCPPSQNTLSALLSDSNILGAVVACLSAKNVSSEVLGAVMELLENLLNFADQNKV